MLPSATTEIVYEDAEIRVMYRGGGEEFLIISFGDLVTLADGMRFFADKPVHKTGLSCLGFMAKGGNWYPPDSVHKAIRASNLILTSFGKRITYGGSMGGYAAVKYSLALGATHVLSLCPQWSIDSDECGGINPGWQGNFNPSMRGMGVKAGDISGKIFVLSDLFHSRDRFHAVQMKKLGNNVNIINIPRVGHQITAMLAGTDRLLALIGACFSDNADQIRLIANASRKRHDHRVREILNFARSRYPEKLNARILAAYQAQENFIKQRPSLVYRALAHCLTLDDHQMAIETMHSFSENTSDMNATWRAWLFLSDRTKRPLVIKTFHDTHLCLNHEDNVLSHVGRASALTTLIHICIEPDGAYLYAVLGGAVVYISDRNGNLIPTSDRSRASRIEVISNSGNSFSMRISGNFVSSERPLEYYGRTTASRDKKSKWEEFHFALMPPQAIERVATAPDAQP